MISTKMISEESLRDCKLIWAGETGWIRSASWLRCIQLRTTDICVVERMSQVWGNVCNRGGKCEDRSECASAEQGERFREIGIGGKLHILCFATVFNACIQHVELARFCLLMQ